LEDNWLIGQAGGRHEGHGLVLVALGLDFSADGDTALHPESLIGSRTAHDGKLPWTNIPGNPKPPNHRIGLEPPGNFFSLVS
jgi:hypothetical protein